MVPSGYVYYCDDCWQYWSRGIHKLSQHGISVVRGCHGNIEDILNAYLKGELVDSSIVCDHLDCDHHAEPGEQFRIAVGEDMK